MAFALVERVLGPSGRPSSAKARGVRKGKVDREYMARMCPDFADMEAAAPEYKERCATDAGITKAFPLPPLLSPVVTIDAASTGVDAVAWLGSDLVTASHDGSVKIFELDAAKRTHHLRKHLPRQESARGPRTGHRGGVYTCCVSPDGRTLVTGGRGSQGLTSYDPGDLLVWSDAFKQATCLPGHGSAVYSAGFSPTAPCTVSCNRGGDVLLHDLARPERPLFSKHVHQGVAHHAAFCLTAPDLYLSTGVDGCIRTRDVRTPVPVREKFWMLPSTAANYVHVQAMEGIEKAHGGEAVHSAVWLDNHTIISAGADFKLKKWDLRRGHGGSCVLEYLGHLAPVRHVAVDAGRVCSACADGSLRVWPLRPRDATDEALADVGQKLRTADALLARARSDLDTDRLAEARKQRHALLVRQAEVKASAARGEREGQQGALLVLDGHRGVASCAAWRGDLLASSSWDQTVRLYEVDRA